MSDKRHFSVSDLKGVGLRIRSCRTLTGLNQEEFSIKHNFSLPSVKAWEFGRVVPRIEGLQKLIDALRADGIFVKINWLLFGEGTGPSFFLDAVDNSSNAHEQFQSNYIESFKLECKKSKQNPIIVTIEDDEMSPYYRKGDVMAGVLIDDKDLNHRHQSTSILLPMLSILPNGNYAPRWVHVLPEGIFTSSLVTPHIKKLEPVSIGRICWHQYAKM